MHPSEPENTLANRIKSRIDPINELSNISNEGAWIVIETDPQDYCLSHLAHLVEQNNARIIDLFSYLDEETAKTFIGFKIDLEDAANVIRSLERFNYSVKYYIQKQGLTDETMKNRLDELIYYLEM